MKKILKLIYNLLDTIYLNLDIPLVKGENSLRLLPSFNNRKGGKISYAEWAHDIGIFKTLILQNTINCESPEILDIGCGRGFLAISSAFLVKEKGTYTGIDINKNAIEFCKKHYKNENMSFIYLNHHNPYYNDVNSVLPEPWPIDDNSKDLLTALSVWTHLNEQHAKFYMNEVGRVLKTNGKAIITFFCLDGHYENMLSQSSVSFGKYYKALPNPPVFSEDAYGSSNWKYPKWAGVPEEVIAVTIDGLKVLLKNAGLRITEEYPGKWKEIPGLYLQDIFILEKVKP